MITFVITVLLVAQASARPPTRNQAVPQPNSPEVKAEGNEAWDLGVDYNRYLQEVVQVLESDPEFRKKLETSDVEKIRDGSIAQELEFVHHNLRTKLDNVKRKEIDRYVRTTQVVAYYIFLESGEKMYVVILSLCQCWELANEILIATMIQS